MRPCWQVISVERCGETIKYGDEKVHSRYEMNAISQGFATVLNKEKATRTEELRIALNHGVYVTNHNYDGYRISLKYPKHNGNRIRLSHNA